jgi:tetratricopeptide (TPR) repeat protein
MDDRRAIDDLRKLAARDKALGAREHRLLELDAVVRRIRERAEAMEQFFVRYEEARRRARSAIDAADAAVAMRGRQVADAEAALAAEGDQERRELARRALERAEDHLSVAHISHASALSDAEQLEQQAEDWQEDLPELERVARELSPDLPDVEPPGSGGRILIEWAAHAHATLFVAVRQVETERERVIREANELASALLGEPTYGSTAAQALDRVEHAVR